MNSKLTLEHQKMLKSLIDVSQAYTIFCMQDLKKSPTLMRKLSNGHHIQVTVNLSRALTVAMNLIDSAGKSEPLFEIHAGPERKTLDS